jgi:hypothetical protein
MNELSKLLEAFTIRLLWVAHSLRPKKTPGICPPACSEGHTYQYPCRARIKRPVKSKVGAYHDTPLATNVKVLETDAGLLVTGKLTEAGQKLFDENEADFMAETAGSIMHYQFKDTRYPECVERWPECKSGEYNPSCCRFPKSCSCSP